MKQKEYIGFGAITHLIDILDEISAGKIFLVTGKESYSKSGAKEHLGNLLTGYEVTRYCDFNSNPKVEDVQRGIELFNQVDTDVVISVGGGSVMDVAKLVNFFGSNKLSPVKFLETKQSNIRNLKSMIAIPTTAGSGSEATQFAVFYKDKKKYSVDNECVLPDVSIVDPCLTMSLPRYITATTGMDALSQAVESYWSINSTGESKVFAKKAIELIILNLADAVNSPNKSARLAMSKAANLAGKAINITRTTASHAASYSLTSYFGIAHGHAVALTLPEMLEYNVGVTEKDLQDIRGCEYVRKTMNNITHIIGQNNIANAKGALTDLMNDVGLQTRLSKLGINSTGDIEMIAGSFNPARAANNPRKITKESLIKILEAIF